MSTMKNFYEVLVSTVVNTDQDLQALAALTTMEVNQLRLLAGDLGWQQWASHDLTSEMAA